MSGSNDQWIYIAQFGQSHGQRSVELGGQDLGEVAQVGGAVPGSDALVVNRDGDESVADLLAVGAGVLDGGGAGGAGDADQVLDAGQVVGDCEPDEVIEGFTGLDGEVHVIAGRAGLDAPGDDADHRSGVAVIWGDEIAGGLDLVPGEPS
jgi:hypothetical protein